LLPCWGGITPGKTSWQEANQILESVITILDIDENHQCTFGPCKVIIWRSRSGSDPHGSVKSQNDTIAEIVLQGYPPSPVMRLDKILTQYGQPEKVFIVTNPVSITMDITLAYPNHGFIIMFRWDQSISHENIVGCIQERWVYLSVNQITETWSDSYIKNKLYGSGDIKEVDFRPLESVTNMSIEQFYEKFKNIDGSECIVAPIRIWQPEEEDDDPV
jgi:acylphosphatase